ncbi:MAG: CoA transferase [Actinomycetota bacterium]
MLLSPYRVLDLTDERGQLAGQMLAQLGAEVIAIEPPGGSRSRTMSPFADDTPGPETSLRHQAYNRGKRSVVLDLQGSEDDRVALRELAAGADVIIESSEPGTMAALGLGPDHLAAINPTLVYTSISAFGQTGPKAGWAATDLTVWAAAGPPRITGDTDRAPLRTPGGQAFIHASAEAAGASVAALYERGTSGLGQHVDVSAQQAAAQATQSNVLAHPNGDTMLGRAAGGLTLGGIFIQLLWPCADGHVSVTFLFGSVLGIPSRRLMEIVHDEGFCDEATRDKDWIAYGEQLLTGVEPVQEYDRVKQCIHDWCMSHTKAELLELATTKRLLIAPVNMVDDVCGLDQFTDREYWDDVDGVRHPGPFAKMSATPLARPSAAPRLGADTQAVLGEAARQPSVALTTETETASPRRPLEGLKVLDFMWVMAGPAGTRVLADLGATVIRIESASKIDTARTLQPFHNDTNSLETSALFANMNAGKLSFTVNPTTDEGRAVIHDLVRWADVVTESYSPRGMLGFGLTYDDLREINPDIVMLSSCLFGQTGPLAMFAGYGTMAAAMTGFFGITGWPDRAPSGPFGAYTDYISPRFANAALLAALDHRRRTGEGQYIDFAQAEGSLHAVAPYVLDLSVNGRVTTPIGNTDPDLAPHGIFPCQGDDEWVAIAARDDADRARIESVIGGLDEATIAAWSAERTPDDVERLLQARNVPVHRVASGTSIVEDPQMVHRNHFVTVPHASLGEFVVEGPRFTMSRNTTSVGSPPTMGQHTSTVLTDVLGYDDERMVELLISGALE